MLDQEYVDERIKAILHEFVRHYEKGENMFHFLRQVALWVVIAYLVGQWQLLVIASGVELLSQSFHASQHHPNVPFAKIFVKVAGGIVALLGIVLFHL